MKRKRGPFMTFILSCIPGAGQMYLGFFNEGVSLMLLFPIFLLLLPVAAKSFLFPGGPPPIFRHSIRTVLHAAIFLFLPLPSTHADNIA